MSELTRAAVADAVSYFDYWLRFRQGYARIPGVQAAVLYDDEIMLSSAYGYADIEAGTELTRGHLFRIASHSKTFTATAVLQLLEQGALRLDDAVERWVPFLHDSAAGRLTLRELLAHGSGLVRDGHDGDFWQLYHSFPDEEQLKRIATDRADIIAANERFKYSNIGYGLLGLVVAAASGQSYNSYVTEHVVARLGLADTGPEYEPARAGDFARGYSSLAYADHRVPIDQVDTRALAAATGFYSTAEDVVRYAAAHFDGDERLLTDESKRLMRRAEWTVEGGQSEYGFGLARFEFGGRRVYGHGGGYPGHITRTYFDPADRLAVSVLTNAIDGPADTLANALIRLVNLAVEGAPLADGGSPPPANGVDLRRFTGRYANLWRVSDVALLGGRLYLMVPTSDDPTQGLTPLTVVDDRTLKISGGVGYGSYGEALTFEFDGAAVVSVRGGSATTSYPIDELTAAAAKRATVSVEAPLR
ncbi:serine hydrolase domain-containing protein [Phytoactinopolyspora limicola]|uniref:serine hydrolase domain-containing protein n=1 Tax=Phytoactinopolyspora limicola TaxID=2715536 RepID=UPI0014086C68|nr:serine hydrolase domain-containing protein [Phytoactinopolyspora limicola]